MIVPEIQSMNRLKRVLKIIITYSNAEFIALDWLEARQQDVFLLRRLVDCIVDRECGVPEHINDDSDKRFFHIVFLTWLTFKASARYFPPSALIALYCKSRVWSVWTYRCRVWEVFSDISHLTRLTVRPSARWFNPSARKSLWGRLRVWSVWNENMHEKHARISEYSIDQTWLVLRASAKLFPPSALNLLLRRLRVCRVWIEWWPAWHDIRRFSSFYLIDFDRISQITCSFVTELVVLEIEALKCLNTMRTVMRS